MERTENLGQFKDLKATVIVQMGGEGKDLRYTSVSDLIGFLSPLPAPKSNAFLNSISLTPPPNHIGSPAGAACFKAGPTAASAAES